MKHIVFLALIGGLMLGGWASAQKQELLNHPADAHLQQMDDNSCSSNPSSGGQ